MPSAPTLTRPPKLQDPTSTGAQTGGSATGSMWDKPATGGNNSSLVDAALGSSARSGGVSSGGITKGQPADFTPATTSPAGISKGTSAANQGVGAVTRTPSGLSKGIPFPDGTAPTATPRPPGGIPTLPPDSGAPPGTPDTGFNIPLLPQDEAIIQAANQDYTNQVASANLGMGQAASAYGDPTQMARFGVGGINPNSALALAALRAQQQQQLATQRRGSADTLFSSLALQDRGTIDAAHQRADLAGYQKYQSSLAKFNGALIAAQTARDKAINAARADERAAAIANLPTPNTASGGAPSSTATGSKSVASSAGTGTSHGKPVVPPKAPGKGAAPKVPKTTKSGKPGHTSPGTVKKPSSGGTVKKPPKVAARK
jgi:hypothetical protein